jgi:head-tail adaptor
MGDRNEQGPDREGDQGANGEPAGGADGRRSYERRWRRELERHARILAELTEDHGREAYVSGIYTATHTVRTWLEHREAPNDDGRIDRQELERALEDIERSAQRARRARTLRTATELGARE